MRAIQGECTLGDNKTHEYLRMAPAERKKPARLQKQSYSLDIPKEETSTDLYRTASVTLAKNESNNGGEGPPWLRRSRDKLGETPEYLIRTGSMKSKTIDDPDRDTKQKSDKTSYVVQTGCYMWTGRSYHRDSYIVHRRERRGDARGGMEDNTRTEGYKDRLAEERSKDEINADVMIKYYEKPNPVLQETKVRRNEHRGWNKADKGGKEKSRKGDDNDKKIQNDDILQKPVIQKQTLSSTKLFENRIFPRLDTLGSLASKEDKQVQMHPINGVENKNSLKDIKPVKLANAMHSQSLPSQPRKTLLELMNRMREQIKNLLAQQLEVDHKILTNEVIASDIAAQLAIIPGETEVAKFNLHITELESVHNLILGLAARLAKAEEGIEELGIDNSESFLLARKREKLVDQLAEARWIRQNINRRSIKVIVFVIKFKMSFLF